jgi:hypothetical protein
MRLQWVITLDSKESRTIATYWESLTGQRYLLEQSTHQRYDPKSHKVRKANKENVLVKPIRHHFRTLSVLFNHASLWVNKQQVCSAYHARVKLLARSRITFSSSNFICWIALYGSLFRLSESRR